MHALTRAAVFIMALTSAVLYAMAHPAAQQQKEDNPTGSISGRVTIEGKPAPDIVVMFMPSESSRKLDIASAKAKTDREGLFQLTHVPAGSYRITAFTPAYIPETDRQFFREGKTVMLAEGESLEGINFELKRGGVITGRITDANGGPLVRQRVSLVKIGEKGQKQGFYTRNQLMMLTDDRGIYRVYGIPPGTYRVSVGVSLNRGYVSMGVGDRYLPITYYPSVADESKAALIEVSMGSETTGIDITTGRVEKAFTVRGRIISADTGKPLANQEFGYGAVAHTDSEGDFLGNSASDMRSDDKGEFRIDGVLPGKYAAFLSMEEGSELYATAAPFEITNEDISGVELKVYRGASITGAVIIEGLGEQEAASKLSEIKLAAFVQTSIRMFQAPGIKINSDGGFRLTGLQPGKAQIAILYPPPKGIFLQRVERDGAEQREGLELTAGENVSGVKLVMGYGTGVIRGQVKVETEGDLPAAVIIRATLQRKEENGLPLQRTAVTDARGRFIVEGLVSGEYRLELISTIASSPGGQVMRVKGEQTVAVTNNAETSVTLTLEPNK